MDELMMSIYLFILSDNISGLIYQIVIKWVIQDANEIRNTQVRIRILKA